eukprot:Nk52_evm1s2542 gene=Nk52_evmTU1s2542
MIKDDLFDTMDESNDMDLDVDEEGIIDFLVVEDEVMRDKLIMACLTGDPEELRAQLDSGRNPLGTDSDGRYALHAAAYGGNIACLVILVENHFKERVDVKDLMGYTPLQWCCAMNHLEGVRYLCSKGADPSHGNNRGQDALFIAASNGHSRIVNYLIQSTPSHMGLSVNLEDVEGHISLHYAAAWGLSDSVKALLRAGASASAKDTEYNRTPLHFASYANHKEVVLLLIENMLEGEKTRRASKISHLLDSQDSLGLRPMHAACFADSDDALSLLIEHECTISKQDHVAMTPLHIACKYGSIKCAKLLITAGASVDSFDSDNGTPLYYAILSGKVELVKLLISSDASLYAKCDGGKEYAHVAAESNMLEILKVLNFYGCRMDSCDDDDCTPLFLSCKKGHLDIVSFLLGLKDQVNGTASTSDGMNALHFACLGGNEKVVRMIFNSTYFAEKGISEENSKSKVPYLHFAVQGENIEVVKFLLLKGSAVGQCNAKGESALCMAALLGLGKICSLLIEKGADVNAVDEKGRAPLHFASSGVECTKSVFKILIEAGANIFAVDYFNNSAIHYSAFAGNVYGVKKLMKEAGDKAPLLAEVKNKDKRTALHFGVLSNSKDVCNLLIELGNHPSEKDADGRSPLGYACITGMNIALEEMLHLSTNAIVKQSNSVFLAAAFGQLECLNILQEHGLSVRTRDPYGRTALHLAVARGGLDCIEWLMDNGLSANDKDKLGLTPMQYSTKVFQNDKATAVLRGTCATTAQKLGMSFEAAEKPDPQTRVHANPYPANDVLEQKTERDKRASLATEKADIGVKSWFTKNRLAKGVSDVIYSPYTLFLVAGILSAFTFYFVHYAVESSS